MVGAFGIGDTFSASGCTATNTSITSDGAYLYLYIGIHIRKQLIKIGTGEEGTTAGKVYNSQPADLEGEITWVYCQDQLFARQAQEEFGKLVVYDPNTLKQVSKAKLITTEVFDNPKKSEQFNKNYPLLTDGKDLFIVTCQVLEKSRKLKEGFALHNESV